MINRKIRTLCAVSMMAAALTFGGIIGGETAFAATGTVESGSNMSVNMRAGTGTDYDVVAAVPNGASVEVGSLVNGWYEVTYNGTSGYIRSDLIETGSSDSSDTSNTTDSSSGADSTSDSEPTGVTATDGDLLIDGTYYNVVNDFTAEQMPDGFSYTAVIINDEDTNAAYNETLDMYLVRLTSTANGETGWFVHDGNVTDYFYPYLTVGSSDNYIIVENTNDTAKSGYSKDELPLDTFGILQGFRSGTGDSNHYIVYGVTNTGSEGWYIVDPTTNTFVSSEGMTSLTDTYADESADAAGSFSAPEKLYRRIIAVLILIIVIMIIAMIAGSIRRRNEYEDFFDDDEDDYEEDDYDEDETDDNEDGIQIEPENRVASKKTVANQQKVTEDEPDSNFTEHIDDTLVIEGLDLDLINSAAAEEAQENAAKQEIIKGERRRTPEEILRAERAAEKARQQALKEIIKPSERPDNIDIIDLN